MTRLVAEPQTPEQVVAGVLNKHSHLTDFEGHHARCVGCGTKIVAIADTGRNNLDAHQAAEVVAALGLSARITQAKAEAMAPVIDFINQRPEYITALKHSSDAGSDYFRWSGHAEARRQLANRLDLPVPHEYADRIGAEAGDPS